MSNNAEIDEIVNKLVTLRRQCEKSKNPKIERELKKIQGLCISKLEYLIDLRTRRYKGFSNYEDLKQDARLSLQLALHSYNPEKGDFFWWANKYIKTKVCREANRHSTIKIPLKYTKDVHPYKVFQIPVMIDESLSALETISKHEKEYIIRKAIDKLPEQHRKVISLYYEVGNKVNCSSVDKICSSLSISRVSCVKLLQEATEQLKQELSNIEF
jgi:RNA polymerase sigma factor (sigma-70 family)